MPDNIALFNVDSFLWVNHLRAFPDDMLCISEGCLASTKDGYYDQIARFKNQDEAIYILLTAGWNVGIVDGGQVVAVK
jgi:hypothetical protein